MTDSVLFRDIITSNEALGETEIHIDRLTPQALIDALIAIELAFEREREELSQSGLSTVSWYRMLRTLTEHHRLKREPYVQQYIAQQERSGGRDGFADQSTNMASS